MIEEEKIKIIVIECSEKVKDSLENLIKYFIKARKELEMKDITTKDEDNYFEQYKQMRKFIENNSTFTKYTDKFDEIIDNDIPYVINIKN